MPRMAFLVLAGRTVLVFNVAILHEGPKMTPVNPSVIVNSLANFRELESEAKFYLWRRMQLNDFLIIEVRNI
jgi:hypothetical protein